MCTWKVMYCGKEEKIRIKKKKKKLINPFELFGYSPQKSTSCWLFSMALQVSGVKQMEVEAELDDSCAVAVWHDWWAKGSIYLGAKGKQVAAPLLKPFHHIHSFQLLIYIFLFTRTLALKTDLSPVRKPQAAWLSTLVYVRGNEKYTVVVCVFA